VRHAPDMDLPEFLSAGEYFSTPDFFRNVSEFDRVYLGCLNDAAKPLLQIVDFDDVAWCITAVTVFAVRLVIFRYRVGSDSRFPDRPIASSANVSLWPKLTTATLYLRVVVARRLIRYSVDDRHVFRCLAPLDDGTAERFGDASARVIFVGNGIGEALDAKCQACPPRNQTHSLTTKALLVELFPNPNA
jgi:hypothetical protein